MPNALTTFVDRMGSQRLLIVLLGLGTMGVVFAFAQWGMAPSFVPVVSGLPIERIGEATQLLEDTGIEYRLERGGGMVAVADRDAARARVALASQGLTGNAGAPGFELFDQPAWGMTDFTQRVNYRRALEGELERTISEMRDVERARVHLALQQGSLLRASSEAAEASIVLRLRSGSTPDASVVDGIQSLVAGSVEGLAPERVTVIDDRGRRLSTADTEDGAGLTSAQLEVRRQIEEYLERRAEAMVSRVVGSGNTSVRVAADLNFDQVARTVQALDPEEQMLVTEDRAEITPGDLEQGAASITRNTTFEATRSVETLSRGGARLERLTVAVLVADRMTLNTDGTPRFDARPAEELRRLEALVANAVGISIDRGDQISVVSAPFELEPPMEEIETPFDFTGFAMAAQRPVIALAGLGVALFLSLQILGTLKTLAPARTAPRVSSVSAPEPMAQPQSRESLPSGAPQPAPGIRVADPEMAARVLRSWMQEA
jgi:flagellar M-ring protein FliF